MTRRLLLAGAGSGGFTPFVPLDEQGRFVRIDDNPVFTDPTAPLSAAHEPTVMIEAGTWKLWYTGGPWPGFDICATGYATSPDGINWTRYVGNPVVGFGGAGISDKTVEPCVFKFGSTYWMYVCTPDGVKHVLTSTDGYSDWTEGTFTATAPPGTTPGWGNTFAWQESGTWYAFFDADGYSLMDPWQAYLYTSADGLTWTIMNSGNPLTSLQVTPGGMYGNCRLVRGGEKIDGKYHMYYHAAPPGYSDAHGNLPTDIHHAWSTDKINWTIVTPNPILAHMGGSTFEFDQVADAWVIENGAGQTYMYYSGENNTNGHASVGLAIADATLEELIGGY